MKKRIFVTGTGTEVGKTFVTRAIVRALVNQSKNVVALKPVESGVPTINGQLAPSDVLALKNAARSTAGIESLCAYMFKDPISPHLAAKNEGRQIETKPILDLLNDIDDGVDVVVAEGAGGLLVPLSDSTLYADIIKQSGFELLIVAPDTLGTINNTLSTIEAAVRRNIPVAGVVLNMGPNSAFGNATAIMQHSGVPILGTLPTTKPDDELLAAAAAKHLELDTIAGE